MGADQPWPWSITFPGMAPPCLPCPIPPGQVSAVLVPFLLPVPNPSSLPCPGHHPNKHWARAAPSNVPPSPSSLVKYDHATAMSQGSDQLGAELLTAVS